MSRSEIVQLLLETSLCGICAVVNEFYTLFVHNFGRVVAHFPREVHNFIR